MPRIILICICTLIFFGCEKPNKPDPVTPDPVDSISAPKPVRNNKVSAEVKGVLLSATGTPYEDGGSSYGIVGMYDIRKVNRVGIFSFSLPSLNEDATILHADFENNIPMSAPLILQNNRVHFVQKRVLSKYNSPAIINVTGTYGNIGASPGGLAFQHGDSCWMDYTNNRIFRELYMEVKYKWIGATTTYKQETQPGDMRGLNSRNELVIINPYAMAGFTVNDRYSSNRIDVAPGKKIMASVLIDSMDRTTAPAIAPLWEYDMQDGLWKETGTAQRVGNRYQGNVSKKGWFSVAEQSPAVYVHLKFVDTAGKPLQFIMADIDQPTPGRAINRWPNRLYTNSTGEISTYVAYNKICNIALWEQSCATSGIVKTIGPLTNNLWKTIEVRDLQIQSFLIEGSAFSCNKEPMKNGWFYVKKGVYEYVYPFTDGKYSFRIPVCSGDSDFSYKIADLSTSKYTEYKPFTPVKGGKITFPETELCN